MRLLFNVGGGSATVYATAGLAWAARTEGHQVILAVPEENVAEATALGLPAVAITEMGIFQAMFWDRQGNRLGPPPAVEGADLDFSSRAFGRLAAASHEPLVQLATAWRPDAVVGGTRNYAAPLIAHQFGIPYVCQAWDSIERRPDDLRCAAEELRPELEPLGLAELPKADLYIHPTPRSVRPADAEPAQPMRWTPGNRQEPLEPWMYTRSERPRVCITSGSRSGMIPALGAAFFRPLLANRVFTEVELVIATTDQVATELRAEFPDLGAGFAPLDVLAHTCDLVVHHAGGVTCLTALNAGVPQVSLANMRASAPPMRRIEEYGAAVSLPADASPEDVAAACDRVLADGTFRARAHELAQEIAAAPTPAEVARMIEKLPR